MISNGVTKAALRTEINHQWEFHDPAEYGAIALAADWDFSELIADHNTNVDLLSPYYDDAVVNHLDFTMNGATLRGRMNSNWASLALGDGNMYMYSVQGAVIDQVRLDVRIDSGYSVIFDFGDGTPQTINGTGVNTIVVTSNYTTNNTTYKIKLSGDLSHLIWMEINDEETLTLCLHQLNKLTGLKHFLLSNGLVTSTKDATGDLGRLSGTLTYLKLHYDIGQKVFTTVVPPGDLDNLYLNGFDNIAFDIDTLPETLTECFLLGLGELTGTINSLPPNMVTFYLSQVGTSITGSINNLPSTLQYFYCDPIGAVTGTINTFSTFSNLLYLWMNGANFTLTGSIDNLPSQLVSLNISSANATLTGSIDNLPDIIPIVNQRLGPMLILVTAGTIAYNGGVLPAWEFDAYNIYLTVGLSTAEVDDFLIKWAATAAVQTTTLYIDGSNGARSSASDAAVATLAGKGITVVAN